MNEKKITHYKKLISGHNLVINHVHTKSTIWNFGILKLVLQGKQSAKYNERLREITKEMPQMRKAIR